VILIHQRYRQPDGRTDGQTDGQTDRQTDRQTDDMQSEDGALRYCAPHENNESSEMIKFCCRTVLVHCSIAYGVIKTLLCGIRYRVYCLVGDGESTEGAIWEALHFASQYRLDNLVTIFDINRFGGGEVTSLQHDMATYQRRLTAFGFVVLLCLLLRTSSLLITL